MRALGIKVMHQWFADGYETIAVTPTRRNPR